MSSILAARIRVPCRGFPCSRTQGTSRYDPEKRPHRDGWPRRAAWLPTNSLYLPGRSGISTQRRVRARLPAPPFSLRPRRRRGPSASRPPPQTPCSRGVWGEGPGKPEPETAGSGFERRRSRRSSLLPSWAVRIRSEFAPAKGGAQQRPHRSRMVSDRAAQNASVSRIWAGGLSASGR